jgi:diadenosine tetraphosphate (Ap4A) HIT family hydrolase
VSGSAWDDPSHWEELKQAGACPICLAGRPEHVLADRRATWITAAPEAPLPGYACVVSKRHVVEPFELPADELAAFWDDAMFAARVLKTIFDPAKLNYEIHGNTIPHLHLHLYPRYAGDPYVGGPIDFRLTGFSRTHAELERMRRAFEDAVAERPSTARSARSGCS